MAATGALVGCGGEKSIVSISKTSSDGFSETYRVIYSDGSTKDFKVEGSGTFSQITAEDLYEEYKRVYGDISYDEFLSKYLGSSADGTDVIQNCLRSSVSVYAEFTKTQQTTDWFGRPIGTSKSSVLQMGSGIIYQMADDYTYIVTNYHVVYGEDTDTEFTDTMHIYLYGSEEIPASSTGGAFQYGDYAIDCEYVGGSASHDIAVLKVDTADIIAINPNVVAVEIADDYSVGQTAIAIGNTGGYGISATRGIVSVDNEYINLEIGGEVQSYRSIRIDTAIYAGNSGGGLFDMYGKLIGLTNSGAQEEQNVNYAIPVQIVTGAADNIIANAQKGYDTVRTTLLGVNVQSLNVRNAYDAVTNTSRIVEDVRVASVESGSIASSIGVQAGDLIEQIIVDGNAFEIRRNFQISDALLTVREGSVISAVVTRDGSPVTLGEYTVQASDLG